jgi:hypothetical protein
LRPGGASDNSPALPAPGRVENGNASRRDERQATTHTPRGPQQVWGGHSCPPTLTTQRNAGTNSNRCVIPKRRAFTSGARDLHRSGIPSDDPILPRTLRKGGSKCRRSVERFSVGRALLPAKSNHAGNAKSCRNFAPSQLGKGTISIVPLSRAAIK